MSSESLVPETKVLAIASHVVYGYVGNTMAAFVMQSLGCEVAALHTVHFSNHTGYGHVKGTKTSAQEIHDIYNGLKQNHLTDFDALLSGYTATAEAVEALGSIARDLKSTATTNPGSFFWVLDPVMGDEGRLYVNEDVVPAYKNLLHHADMILPNAFEAQLLSGIEITSTSSLTESIAKLHQSYRIPHIVITSVRFDPASPTISIVGSSARSDGTPRLFQIDVPAIDCFFSGTGDLFASLMLVRFREVTGTMNLHATPSWVCADEVDAVALPLTRAAETVLGSMHRILQKTKRARDEAFLEQQGSGGPRGEESEQRLRVRMAKAAEVRVVRNVADLKEGKRIFRARAFDGTGGGGKLEAQSDENAGKE